MMPGWQDRRCGGGHRRVLDRRQGSGSGRARFGPGREGGGDRGAAPPVDGAAPRSPALATPRPTDSSSPPWPGSCRGSVGRSSWSRLRRCCGGTGISCAAVGTTGPPVGVILAPWRRRPSSLRRAWRGRIRAGGTCGSPANAARPASRRRRPRSVPSLLPPARPGATPRRTKLGGVPASAGHRGDRVEPPDRRNDQPDPAVWGVPHRAGASPGTPGITAHPTGGWTAQAAGNVLMH